VHFADVIHIDIWGPAMVHAPDHSCYMLTMVNDATRWLHMVTLQHKSDTFAKFITWQTFLKMQYNLLIKCVQSDNDTMFLSCDFKLFLESNGM
jgi:hypothetical protein